MTHTSNQDSKMQLIHIISGSVSAYKALELLRLFSARGHRVHPVLTQSGCRFVTPLAVSAVAGRDAEVGLWEVGPKSMHHIRLARLADAIVIAPASADRLAQIAHGRATDLAGCILLATRAPIVVAPAMNPFMWEHTATQENVRTLRARGVTFVGPEEGQMACGEEGWGRMAEPERIFRSLRKLVCGAGEECRASPTNDDLRHLRVVVTSGATREFLDPVRYFTNCSSGKQGEAIAVALQRRGAQVILVRAAPLHQAGRPDGIDIRSVASARDMFAEVRQAMPADVVVCCAAVADWRPVVCDTKKQKRLQETTRLVELTVNPDILAWIGQKSYPRPRLVVGFAAETVQGDLQQLLKLAKAKRMSKKCDWLLANDVSAETFGSNSNQILLCSQDGEELWPRLDKQVLAYRLGERIAQHCTEK